MKAWKMIVMAVVAVGLISGVALAVPKSSGVTPSCTQDGKVTIPMLERGKIMQVWKFDDLHGIPGVRLGGVHSFQLKECEGFNFEFSDADGTWWDLITPASRAQGLATDCSHPEGCKWLYDPRSTCRDQVQQMQAPVPQALPRRQQQ